VTLTLYPYPCTYTRYADTLFTLWLSRFGPAGSLSNQAQGGAVSVCSGSGPGFTSGRPSSGDRRPTQKSFPLAWDTRVACPGPLETCQGTDVHLDIYTRNGPCPRSMPRFAGPRLLCAQPSMSAAGAFRKWPSTPLCSGVKARRLDVSSDK